MVLIICCDGFNETLYARMFVDHGCVRRVRVAAGTRHQRAVRGKRARAAALRAAAARPVHARATPLARHVAEAVHQQRRSPSPCHRVTHLCLA